MKIKDFKYLVIIVVIFVLGCEENEETPAESNDIEASTFVTKPVNTITIGRAKDLYNAYQQRAAALATLKGEGDATYGWHSIEFYKDYIAYLEVEAEKIGYKISGIRMYYVAYPKDDAGNLAQGYQTYMYVPTYFNEKLGKHIAFDPLLLDEDGKPLDVHGMITGEYKYSDGSKIMDAETSSSIANLAEMCKPNCY